MLHSVLIRHPDSGIHFLHGAETATSDYKPLAQMVKRMGGQWQAHYIPAERMAGLPRMRHIPAVMWYRVLLPALLPDVSRVLYLDCDTLIVDELTDLWRTDLHRQYVAAVSNVLESDARDWPQQLGLAADYFNSGVLLLNLDAMRRDGLTEKLVSFGRQPPRRLRWPDQDALNVLLGPRRVALHPRWNCQNSLFYYRRASKVFGAKYVAEAVADPAILHFEGAYLAKPWHYLSKHPYRERYFEHRRATPWPRVQILGQNWYNRCLRLLPTRWTIALLKLIYRIRSRLAAMRP